MRRFGLMMPPLFLVLSACAHYTLMPGNSSVNVVDAYNVKIESPWNAKAIGSAQLWTQYGQNLDSLLFFRPADDGKPPLAVATDSGKEMPKFKKSMTFLEFPELVRSSLTNVGYLDIDIFRSEPAKLGEAKALRIDFTMKTESSPRLKGFAVMSVKEERLFSVMFMAEESTYYPLVAPSAEKLIASLALTK